MIWFQYILILMTMLLFIGACIPFIKEQIWWLRAWTYARLQKLAIAVGIAVIYFPVFGLNTIIDGTVFITLIIVAMICLRDILPFTPLGKTQVPRVSTAPKDKRLKLLVANVLMDNNESDGLLRQIRAKDPDVVFCVETDEKWKAYLSALETAYPHQWLLPLEDYNGMLLYSKFPISDANVRRIVQDHIPSVHLTLTLPNDDDIRFHGLHPRPPRPDDDTADLDKELIQVAKTVADETGPIIVTGDLNDVGWSTTSKAFLTRSGLKDPRRGRGLYNTFNAKNPLVRWPLDHIFHTDHFDLIQMERLSKFGSDHFPIFIELALRD